MTTKQSASEAATARPCPFCGATNVYVEKGSTYRWVRAVCAECEAATGDVRANVDDPEDIEVAIEAWNNRAVNAELLEALKEMYAAMIDYAGDQDIPPPSKHIRMMEQARAAIARATEDI